MYFRCLYDSHVYTTCCNREYTPVQTVFITGFRVGHALLILHRMRLLYEPCSFLSYDIEVWIKLPIHIPLILFSASSRSLLFSECSLQVSGYY